MSVSRELTSRLGPMPLEMAVQADTNYVIESSSIAACTIRRGRPDGVSQPSPAVLTTQLVDDGHPRVMNERVRLTLSDDALDALYGSHTSAAALLAQTRYTGLLTDAGSRLIYDAASKPYAVTYASPLSRVNAQRVELLNPSDFEPYGPGDTLFGVPAIAQILLAAGVGLGQLAPLDAHDPLADPTATVTAWIETGPASSLLQAVSEMFGAVLIEWRNGNFDWLPPVFRRDETALEIPAAYIRQPTPTKLDASSLATSSTVSYGDPAATATVTGLSAERLGVRAADFNTHFEGHDKAQSLALDTVGRRSNAGWTLPTITLDLLMLFDAGEWTLLRGLLEMQTERLAELTGLPADPDISDGLRYIVGVQERIARNLWQMDLTLVPFELLGPGIAWDDAPLGVTWDDLPGDLTWVAATTTLGL